MQCFFCSTIVPNKVWDGAGVPPTKGLIDQKSGGHWMKIAYYVNTIYRIQDQTTYANNLSFKPHPKFPFAILIHDPEHCPLGTALISVEEDSDDSFEMVEREPTPKAEGPNSQSKQPASVKLEPEGRKSSRVRFVQKKPEKTESGTMSVWVSVALVVGVLFVVAMVARFGPQMGSSAGGMNPLVGVPPSAFSTGSMNALAGVASNAGSAGSLNALVDVSSSACSTGGMNALVAISSTAFGAGLLAVSQRYGGPKVHAGLEWYRGKGDKDRYVDFEDGHFPK